MSLQVTPGSVTGEHVMLTGPITGSVTTPDGQTFDVSPGVIAVDSPEQAELISALIGEHWVKNGHPDDIELDDDPDSDTHGELVQRPFEHVFDEGKFGDMVAELRGEGKPAAKKTSKKG